MEGLANETNDSELWLKLSGNQILSAEKHLTWANIRTQTHTHTHKTCHIFLWSPLPLTNPCIIALKKAHPLPTIVLPHYMQSLTATLQRFTASQLSCSHFRYPIATSVLICPLMASATVLSVCPARFVRSMVFRSGCWQTLFYSHFVF